MALQTLSDATPTEAIHLPDVLRRAARAAWQHAVEIDDCPRQNSAYRLTHILTTKSREKATAFPLLFYKILSHVGNSVSNCVSKNKRQRASSDNT